MIQEKPWWGYPDFHYESKFGSILPDIPKIVAEAERRGREKALEEVRKAAFKTVAPLSLTLDGEGGTESVDIVAVPKSFFESCYEKDQDHFRA